MPELTSPALPQFPGGEYQIEGVLGRGGMAVVYRARDMRRPRDVAVKVLRAEVAQSIGTTRFHREIAVAAGFSHPHILPLIDSGELIDERGRVTPYYVMPLVDGETLHQRLVREGRLPLQVILRITREILEALQYAHAKGVLHRDIKPANILLSDGHAVVADFGISRPLNALDDLGANEPALTVTGDVIGTPNYMSPEQALGNHVVDARSDMFSVGCVMYEMIVGDRPFDTPIPQYTSTKRRHGIFEPVRNVRPDVPDEWDEVLSKALKADPADRYASAAAFLHALSTLDTQETNRWGLLGRTTPSWMRKVAIGGLAVAGVATAASMKGRATTREAAVRSPLAIASDKSRIAVLPIEQLTPDTLLNVVANGFQTDLIDELAQFPALTVISKNGVLQFRGNHASTDSIARTLNVGSVITGDVRRVGDSVRVTVRLIDGATGILRSTSDTTGSVKDLLAVRSNVIRYVRDVLRNVIGIEVREGERLAAQNSEAWELNARVQSLTASETGLSVSLAPAQRLSRFKSADSMLMRAAALDPRWPAPLITSAFLLLQRAIVEEQIPAARAASREFPSVLRLDAIKRADEALSRDPRSAEAIYMRGKARFELWRTSSPRAPDSLRIAADRDLLAATTRRRDLAQAWTDLSALRQMVGAYGAARDAAANALKADAFLRNAPVVMSRVLIASLAIGRVEEARAWCTRGRLLYPADGQFFGCDLTIAGWTGSTTAEVAKGWDLLYQAEARDSLNLLSSGWATRRLLVAAIAARAGLRDSALEIVQRTRTADASKLSADNTDYGEAHVRTLLGQPDLALPLIARYLSNNPAYASGVREHPWFAALKTDPRFIAMTAVR
ncbi:MAG: serine/threonine-protein kinase [Gemmatimonadaceae bacterium]